MNCYSGYIICQNSIKQKQWRVIKSMINHSVDCNITYIKNQITFDQLQSSDLFPILNEFTQLMEKINPIKEGFVNCIGDNHHLVYVPVAKKWERDFPVYISQCPDDVLIGEIKKRGLL